MAKQSRRAAAPSAKRKTSTRAPKSHAPKRSSSTPKRKKSSGGSSRRVLAVTVHVPDIRADSSELRGLTADQRLQLVTMGPKYRPAVSPSWVGDDALWKAAVRHVHRNNWKRYDHPYAVVALTYQRMGGSFERERHEPSARELSHSNATAQRQPPRRQQAAEGGEPAQVSQVRLDELGYDSQGQYWGREGGPVWRVFTSSIDSVVRAASAAAARALVLGTAR